MGAAGLFVDFENIYLSMQAQSAGRPQPERVAQRLLALAEAEGSLVVRLAWADWDHFPGAQRAFSLARFETRFVPTTAHGKNASDMAMQAEMLVRAGREGAPPCFILATGDRDFLYALQALKNAGHTVVLIGAPHAASMALKAAADRFIPLELGETQPLKPAEGTVPTGALVRQCLEQAHVARGMPWISFRLLVQMLMEKGLMPETSAVAALEEAVADGLVRRDEEHRGNRRVVRFSLPNPISPHGTFRSGSAVSASRGPSRAPLYEAVEAFATAHRSVQGQAIPRLGGDPASQVRRDEPRSGSTRVFGPTWDWQTQALLRILWHVVAANPKLLHEPQTRSALLTQVTAVLPELTLEEARFWVSRGIQRGFFESTSQSSGQEGMEEDASCLALARNHPWLALALELPVCIAESLQAGLSSHPDWQGIAFSYLMRLLRFHPHLSAAELELTPERLKDWINLCLDEQFLYRYETPDVNIPERTTTMVQWNQDHPLAGWVWTQRRMDPLTSPLWQARTRALLTLDHFLVWLEARRPGESWMPLVTLKSWLKEMLGDQLAREAIQGCEDARLFVIDRFPHREQPGVDVAGAVLQRTHPEVEAVLLCRNRVLHHLHALLHRRASVPLPVFREMLEADAQLGPSQRVRASWIPILVDTRIMIVEKEEGGAGTHRSGWSVRLNTRERFVQTLLRRLG